MKTQNQTPEKRNSPEVGKNQTKASSKRTEDEKLGSKKTMQADEKNKANKGATKH
jgi:hypothetical protein